jgi:Zn-dependent protease with chaperone function
MGVVKQLAKNSHKRYFRVKKKIGALSTASGRLIFDEQVYDTLNANERVAVAAHEFVHIRERDWRRQRTHYFAPSIAIWCVPTILWVVFRNSLPLSVIGILLFVGLPLAIVYLPFFLRVLEAEKSREIELRCDRVAAQFVDPSDLASALIIVDRITTPAMRGKILYRWGVRLYPTLQEREKILLDLQVSSTKDVP